MEFIASACALAILLQVVSTSPVVVTPPPINVDNAQCMPTSSFPDGHICKTLFTNVSYVAVPNPLTNDLERSPDHLFNQAMVDFLDFYAALANKKDFCGKKDFCSDKIFTLLCFFYFPICIPGDKANVTVLPCKDTCMEVTDEEGECTRQLIQAQVEYGNEFEDKEKRGWPVHFKNCNYTYKSKSSHTLDVYNRSICVNYNHSTILPANTFVPEFPKAKVAKEDNCNTIDDRLGAGCKCDPREGISKNTFINNPYNYAFECQVKSKGAAHGREAINCTITATYSVSTESAADVNDTIQVLGVKRSEDCEESCFSTVQPGQKYLIAGNFIRRPKCDTDLFFSTKIGEKKAMLVLSSDRNIKRMEAAVNRLKNERCGSQ